MGLLGQPVVERRVSPGDTQWGGSQLGAYAYSPKQDPLTDEPP